MIYKVYTDGAASNNGKIDAIGGWAYIIFKDYKRLKEDSGKVEKTTNNRMELLAVINGLNALFNEFNITGFDKIEVYTDSAYIHNAYINKWYSSWQRNGWINASKQPVKNKDLWIELIPYFNQTNINFNKVQGHKGDTWNEYVDKLAVEARRRQD